MTGPAQGWRSAARCQRSIQLVTWIAWCATQSLGCGGEGKELTGGPASSMVPDEGEPVTPPFAVRDEAEGLLLVWFDAQGAHTAERRGAIPEAHRSRVRVDSLALAPDQRLDPEVVYVADMRVAQADGAYPVRRVSRAQFEAWIDEAAGRATGSEAASDDAAVVLYGASWCGACRSAAKYLRERGVRFVERDIEKDRGAHEELQRKAQKAGFRPRGVPVIDVRGQLLQGFDPQALERALGRSAGR